MFTPLKRKPQRVRPPVTDHLRETRETGARPFKGQAQIGTNQAPSGEVKQQTWMTAFSPPTSAKIPEKSRRRIRGFLITAVQREKLCSVPLRSGGWKQALYKLSGHVGARPAEVSSKRKPLKAECFDVPGSNLTLSHRSCVWETIKPCEREESAAVPAVPSCRKKKDSLGCRRAEEEQHEWV